MAARFPPPPPYYTSFSSSNPNPPTPPAIPDVLPTVDSAFSGSVSRILGNSSKRSSSDFSEVQLDIDDTIIRDKLTQSFDGIRDNVMSFISPAATNKE